MPEIGQRYAYRDDPATPDFDDSKPLFVFDGVCVLCSTGARWLMRADRSGSVNLTSVQSPLGKALYRSYGFDPDDSYLLIIEGRALTASRGYLALARHLGGAWSLFRVAAIIPEGVRDWLYDRLARNRYRLFGKSDHCALLTPDQRARLL